MFDEIEETQEEQSSTEEVLSEETVEQSRTVEQPETSQGEAPESQEVVPEGEQSKTEEQSRTEEEAKQVRNFRRLREEKEKAEKERDELVRYLQSIQKPKETEPEEDLNINVASDDLVEGKVIHKLDKKYKKLERAFEEQRVYSQQVAMEAKILKQFPDFQDVVNDESVSRFNKEEPEIAESIGSCPDYYKKAIAAYKAIKRSEPHGKNLNRYEKEEEIIKRNMSKPKSVNYVSNNKKSPLHNANAYSMYLSEEEADELSRKNEKAIKGV
jgi:hypothetical protein